MQKYHQAIRTAMQKDIQKGCIKWELLFTKVRLISSSLGLFLNDALPDGKATITVILGITKISKI